ncbi:MAG: AraC family transcriptional regulator [Vicinamibacteria bacterium]
MTHSFATLVHCCAGRASVELPARWKLAAGDTLLVPAGVPHRVSDADGFEWYELAVSVAGLPPGDERALLVPFDRVRAGAAPVVAIEPARRPFFETLLRELVDTNDARSEGSAVVRRSLLTLVLHEVQRAWRESDAPPPSAGIAADALRFIESHCLERLSLADVARAVRRSRAYVTTALTRATGRSAVQWITAGRMAEARRRLLHSDEMVDVIAERVGYADPTHFIRTFRRAHGATPAAWRAARRRPRRS